MNCFMQYLNQFLSVFINYWQYTECGLHSDYLRVLVTLFHKSFLIVYFSRVLYGAEMVEENI